MARKRLPPVHPGEVLLEEFLFGTSDRFWLNLQVAHDLDVERDRLEREVAVHQKAS